MMVLHCLATYTVYCVGEFGVVYRAKLLRKQGRNKPELVAVKTMRGTFELEITSACGLTSLISSSNVNFSKRESTLHALYKHCCAASNIAHTDQNVNKLLNHKFTTFY